MKKTEYLDLLRYYLDRFPKSMVDDIIRDYEEHFSIGIENGKTEDEISIELGAPFYVAQEYISGDFDRIHREESRSQQVREPAGFFTEDAEDNSYDSYEYDDGEPENETEDPHHNDASDVLYKFLNRVRREWNEGQKGKWIILAVLVLIAFRILPPLMSFVLTLASLVLVIPFAIVVTPLAGGLVSLMFGVSLLIQVVAGTGVGPFHIYPHPLTSLLLGLGLLGLGVLLLMLTGSAVRFVRDHAMKLMYRIRWEWSKRRDV